MVTIEQVPYFWAKGSRDCPTAEFIPSAFAARMRVARGDVTVVKGGLVKEHIRLLLVSPARFCVHS